MIDDAAFGYQRVNVASQEQTDRSLLTRVKRLIAVRRTHPAFGRGDVKFVETGSPSVLAFLRRYQDDSVLVIANLAASSQQAALQLPAAV